MTQVEVNGTNDSLQYPSKNRDYVLLTRQANLFEQPEFERPLTVLQQLLSPHNSLNMATLSVVLPEVSTTFLEDALRASNELASGEQPIPDGIATNTIRAIVFNAADRVKKVHKTMAGSTIVNLAEERDPQFMPSDIGKEHFTSHVFWGSRRREWDGSQQDINDPVIFNWMGKHMGKSRYLALLRLVDDVFSSVPSWYNYLSRSEIKRLYSRSGVRSTVPADKEDLTYFEPVQTYSNWMATIQNRKEYIQTRSSVEGKGDLNIPAIYTNAMTDAAEYVMTDNGRHAFGGIDTMFSSPEQMTPDRVVPAEKMFDQPFFTKVLEILREINPDLEHIIGKPGFQTVEQIRAKVEPYVSGKKRTTQHHLIDQFIQAIASVASHREIYLNSNPQAVFTGAYLLDEDVQGALSANVVAGVNVVRKLLEINSIDEEDYIRAIVGFESISDLAFPYWTSYIHSYQREVNAHSSNGKEIITEVPAWWSQVLQVLQNVKTDTERERLIKKIGDKWEGLDDILKSMGYSLQAVGRSRIGLDTYRHKQVTERFAETSDTNLRAGQDEANVRNT